MLENTSSIRQTYRITIDIDTMLGGESEGDPGQRHYQALLHLLQERPSLLDQLLRASALDVLPEARKMMVTEYGWERMSEQQILQPLIDSLEPEGQAFFKEEIEAGVNAIYFDGYKTRIKDFRVAKVDKR